MPDISNDLRLSHIFIESKLYNHEKRVISKRKRSGCDPIKHRKILQKSIFSMKIAKYSNISIKYHLIIKTIQKSIF